MTNHVHILLTPARAEGVGTLMKRLGQRYVQYINRAYARTGTLWEGRFRSCIAEQESYVLTCQRYIELNPLRAGIVAHPGEYRWSSYRANAQGERNDLLTLHPCYAYMGRTAEERQTAYRELFRHDLEPGLVDEIRQATNGNFALGSDRFTEEIAQAIGRRATRGKPGRPRKTATTREGNNES